MHASIRANGITGIDCIVFSVMWNTEDLYPIELHIRFFPLRLLTQKQGSTRKKHIYQNAGYLESGERSKEKERCERKEKQEYKIEQSLSLFKKKKEKRKKKKLDRAERQRGRESS
jgi:hypothetical protein